MDGWENGKEWMKEQMREIGMEESLIEWRVDGWKGVNERTIEWEKEVVREGGMDERKWMKIKWG